jgi:hypothetical protein
VSALLFCSSCCGDVEASATSCPRCGADPAAECIDCPDCKVRGVSTGTAIYQDRSGIYDQDPVECPRCDGNRSIDAPYLYDRLALQEALRGSPVPMRQDGRRPGEGQYGVAA